MTQQIRCAELETTSSGVGSQIDAETIFCVWSTSLSAYTRLKRNIFRQIGACPVLAAQSGHIVASRLLPAKSIELATPESGQKQRRRGVMIVEGQPD